MAMTFTVRKDEYSLQLTAPSSRRFFVRIDLLKSSEHSLFFSDFIFNDDEEVLACEALDTAFHQHPYFEVAKTWEFGDIAPNSITHELDKPEIVRRHDQIVRVVKSYIARNKALNSMQAKTLHAQLNEKHGKFITSIFFESPD